MEENETSARWCSKGVQWLRQRNVRFICRFWSIISKYSRYFPASANGIYAQGLLKPLWIEILFIYFSDTPVSSSVVH